MTVKTRWHDERAHAVLLGPVVVASSVIGLPFRAFPILVSSFTVFSRSSTREFHIVGEERIGPYHFINTLAHASGPRACANWSLARTRGLSCSTTPSPPLGPLI